MKRLILICCLLSFFITSNINGQSELDDELILNGLEVQIRPLKLIFGSPNVGFEWVNNKKLGFSFNAGIQLNSFLTLFRDIENEFFIIAKGKYYLQPKYGSDGIYIGAYGRYFYQEANLNLSGINSQISEVTRASLGLALGYKWMSASRVTLDIGGGIGRNIIDRTNVGGSVNTRSFLDGFVGVNVIGNATIGYRFNQI